jgi:lysophospholipase L1-like esterase
MVAIGACSAPEAATNVTPAPGAVWAAGDSLSTATSWPGMSPSPIASVAVAGRGFVVSTNGPTIGANTLAAVDHYGTPAKIVIMGGVNDVKQDVPPTLAQITRAMADLDSALTARGIQVVWATEPGWQYAGQLGPVNNWIRSTRSHVVDCAGTVGSWLLTTDGVHPNEDGQRILHDCIRPLI